ncbi:MAG: hypothetical protein HY268_30280, partial [Deltaproteobacteria bacterium]|nr:hypothetical protein [Deltaproteobacteria bacterium]
MKSACGNRFSVSTKRAFFILLLVLLWASPVRAQYGGAEHHQGPTGKGWSEERGYAPLALIRGNGISWYGGPIMRDTVKVYYIWYGNWQSGPKLSDSLSTVNLLNDLFATTGGIGGSGYAQINTTYSDSISPVTGNMVLAGSITEKYPQGNKLSDSRVLRIVSNALKKGKLPLDANGIYFVLTSSDVTETSGFCSYYC